jgi:hypothetical protein
LTGEGFDLAMDLHEEGYRFTKEDVKGAGEILDYNDMIADLLLRLQERGFEAVKNEVAEIMSKRENDAS